MKHHRPTIMIWGEALYGERWRKPLAERLGVDESTVRRWAAGKFVMPEDAIVRTRGLLRAKARECERLAG